MNNNIFLKRKNKIFIEEGNNTEFNEQYIVTFMKNIEALGYTLSEKLVNVLKTRTASEINDIYTCTICELKKMVGANIKYKPMYPNFPNQVMEMNYVELYINAIIHYWSDGTILPQYQKEKRMPLFDVTKVKIIDLGTEEEYNSIFYNIMNSKTSISNEDVNDLIDFFHETPDYYKYIPEEIPMKENVALIGKLILENSPIINIDSFKHHFKTATDVLRLATIMSNGDVSLAQNTKFRSFTRKERRALLELLENCNSIEEDMARYKNKWIRLGERLHPSEYKEYLCSKIAFSMIRNNEKITTFNGAITKAINNGNLKNVINLLKKRPGEFARKLDYLLRICYGNEDTIIDEFSEVANQVSTPVLLQVKEHFLKRNSNDSNIRVFFPKGNVAKSHIIKNTLSNIDEEYCLRIVVICKNALIQIYKERENIGNVFISERLKNYIVPFSQRSASKSLKTIVRGSRLPYNTQNLDDNSTLRCFLWWKNGQYRTDLDLSLIAFDNNWNYITHVSYTNLKDNNYGICHSGDIVDAPEGASEFCDINLNTAYKKNIRYLVVNVFSYTTQPFCDLPECFMGWMFRKESNSGEIYEPKTVSNKIDISSNTRICIPMIIDIYNYNIIWCDMGLKYEPNYSQPNNVENNQFGISMVCKAMTELIKPNMYDLVKLHVKARGNEVFDKSDADIIFDVDNDDFEINENQKFISPYDLDVWVSQYI